MFFQKKKDLLPEQKETVRETRPLISVCIPVFSTEPFLYRCLRSVIMQDFENFEVVLVSDASRGRDEKGRTAKKIVKLAQKECRRIRKKKGLLPVSFKFIEHRENRGLIEVRRTLCYEASGFYMTQLDSDDELEEGALSALFNASGAASSSFEKAFDIVHGTSVSGFYDEKDCFIPTKKNRYGSIFYGRLYGRDIFRGWLLEDKLTANTWGKLIKRDLWLRSYKNIPYTQCNMADDVLLFFFLAQYAQSYIGIRDKVYRYRVNTGMTSARKIDSLHKWKMVCSAASVFSVISSWINDNQGKSDFNPEFEGAVNPESEEYRKIESALQILLPDEIERIRQMTRYYLTNNIKQMNDTVLPELKSQARQMLCDYWGQSFVELVEQKMSEK